MTAANVIFLVIMGLCSLIMIVIGMIQYQSSAPVGFWSGEAAPSPEDLTDVSAYNHGHGIMWIAYGIGIFLSAIPGLISKKTAAAGILVMAVVCGGLMLMVFYHNTLEVKYSKKDKGEW